MIPFSKLYGALSINTISFVTTLNVLYWSLRTCRFTETTIFWNKKGLARHFNLVTSSGFTTYKEKKINFQICFNFQYKLQIMSFKFSKTGKKACCYTLSFIIKKISIQTKSLLFTIWKKRSKNSLLTMKILPKAIPKMKYPNLDIISK